MSHTICRRTTTALQLMGMSKSFTGAHIDCLSLDRFVLHLTATSARAETERYLTRAELAALHALLRDALGVDL